MYVHMSWLYIYIAFTVRKDLGYLHILKRCSRTPATSLPRGISIAMYVYQRRGAYVQRKIMSVGFGKVCVLLWRSISLKGGLVVWGIG